MQGKGYSVFRLNSTVYTGTLCLFLWPTAITHQTVWIIVLQQAHSGMGEGT